MVFLFDDIAQSLADKLNEQVGEKAVIALSGGMDSMLLLYLLVAVRDVLRFSFSAVHIDHGIRSQAESEQDIAFLQAQCRDLGVTLLIQRAPAGHIAQWQRKTGGLEAGARLFRYRAMQDTLKRGEILLTAHHADDRLETMVLAFFQGSFGSRLLPAKRGNIIRPFLLLTDIPGRDLISQMVSDRSIPFVVDSTNNDEKYRRNFLRNSLLPAVNKQFGNLSKRMATLWQQMTNMQEALTFYAPASPWKPCNFLGRHAACCLVQVLKSQPDYFRVLYTRQAMLRCLDMDHANSSEHRIPRRFILDLLPRVDESDSSSKFEGFGCTLIKENKWIYMLPSLALRAKKGYYRPIGAGGSCIVCPLEGLLLSIRMEAVGSWRTGCVLRTVGETGMSDLARRQVSAVARILSAVPLWMRDGITVLEDEKDILGLVYPNFISGRWEFFSFDSTIQLQLYMETG